MNKKRLYIIFLFLPVFLFLFLFAPLLFNRRSLTENEREILRSVYKTGVDLERVKIKSGGPLTWAYSGITIGNTISFPKGAYDENDQEDQALLVHEVCHVWQYQHFGLGYIPRSLWELVTQSDTYVIHFDASKSLRDYDVEEQCEIVAKYFLTSDEKFLPYLEEVRAQ